MKHFLSSTQEDKLYQKSKADVEKRTYKARLFRNLVTKRGDVCEATRDLAAPCRVVINHDSLHPLSGRISTCNQVGDPDHDPKRPIFYWYQDAPGGKEFYLALYTLPCEWGRCSFCTLPSESSPVEVSEGHIFSQALFALDALSSEQLGSVRSFFLTNNGSMLHPQTMPREVLFKLFELGMARFPGLETISLETRFETVVREDVLAFQRILSNLHERLCQAGGRKAPKPPVLQFTSGYETQDPYLRNAVLWKGYDERRFQQYYALLGEIGKESDVPVRQEENVMLKPAAGMTAEEAIDEAAETILHIQKLGEVFGVETSVRLNPTFAAVGSDLYTQHVQSNYTPPTYRDVIAVLRQCHSRGVRIPVFVGLNNEGLAFEEGTFGNKDGTDAVFEDALTSFNKSGDYLELFQITGTVSGAIKQQKK